jgi:hypothetical protein
MGCDDERRQEACGRFTENQSNELAMGEVGQQGEVSSEWPTIQNYRKLLVAAVATNANRNPEFRALGPENL